MSSMLFYDPRPVYFTNLGAPAAGGSLKFYAAGTTTEQDVYSDSSLSTSLGSTITLDSSGRTTTDIWLDASLSYRVQLYDVGGTQQYDTDDLAIPGGTTNVIPSLVDGEFLTNNGSALEWVSVSQLPDPSGNAGKVVSTDGTDFTFIDAATTEEKSQNVTAAATTTIDFSAGPVVNLSQAVNITTLSITNPPASGTVGVLTIKRKKDNSATARTIAWPSSIEWPGGVDPTLTQTANAVDVFSLLTDDGGTTWYGSSAVAQAVPS